VVGASSSTTEVKVSGLTADASVATNVELAVAGVQGASGDIEIDANGDIISTTLDFTGLGLTAGQTIHVGGSTAGTQFATAANTGRVRVTAITANKLTIDKTSATFTVDNGSSKTIQLLFGQYVRNVSVDHADFYEASATFETILDDLGGVGTDHYWYAKGNYANELTLQLPLTSKAEADFGFVGTDTDPPTASRATNAGTPIMPLQKTAFNTSSEIARLRVQEVDETGISTDFKSMRITLNNGVSPEKTLGNLGASYMNYSNFEVNVDFEALFTSDSMVAAVRNNTTVQMDFTLKNEDGGIHFDLPSMTLGDASPNFQVNESVKLNMTGEAFADGTLDVSLGVSLFPYLP
jgi:hypothetical protein